MSPLFRLLGSVWKYKAYTLLGILFHLFTAILTVLSIPLVIPFFQILFGISPSDYTPPESFWHLEDTLNYGFSRLIAISDHFIALQLVCVVVLILYFLKNLCRFLISFYMVYVRNGLLRDLRASIWAGYESLSLSQRFEQRQGYLMSLITNDLSEVDHGILKVFELLFKTPLIIMGSLLFMIWLNPGLTLIAFGLILFTFFVIGGVSHLLKQQAAKAQVSLSIITVLVDQYLSATRLIRTHQADGYFRGKFDLENESYFKSSNIILRRRDLASPLAEFLGVVTIVVLLYCGTHAVFNDTMEPATFFAFIFAFYNIIDPAKSFSREYANVQKGMAALDRIEAFKNELQSSVRESGQSEARYDNIIELKNVSFAYEEDKKILNSVSFNLNKGERIGIVGVSGTGKTTILDLLLGFFEPLSGQILLEGQDLATFSQTSFRSLFGLVTQVPVLFHGTVRENIILDKEESQAKLSSVLKLVGLTEPFLDKKVGDQSTMISGGEAQRVSLARVLYRSPDIFLLDEPTAQLDSASVNDIIDTIMQVTKERTVVMITHQPKLLKDMDRILILNQGRIVADGQYDTLYQRNEDFRRLVGM